MPSLTGVETVDDEFFENPPDDPIDAFTSSLAEAQASDVREPGGFVLATADHLGRVSSRVVLLLDCNQSGLVFGSHLTSKKVQDLHSNSSAAATFYWLEIMQQVNIVGSAEKLDDDSSDAWFANRPRQAQAIASMTKSGMSVDRSEADLVSAATKLAESDISIARPTHWATFVLVPDSIEFWHGRRSRIHRRLRYSKGRTGWTSEKLQP